MSQIHSNRLVGPIIAEHGIQPAIKIAPALLVAILCLIALIALSSPVAAQTPRPNIILIIGDDQGWPDYGFMPSSRTLDTNQGPMPLNQIVQTPSLDALAAEGVVFRNTHLTASLCLTSLKTLLSSAGLHPFQWSAKRAALDALPEFSLPPGAFPFPRPEVEHIRTLPKDLRQVGYKSWEGGKYWESTFERGGFTHGLALTDGLLLKNDGLNFGRTNWSPALCGPNGDPNTPCPALDPLRDFLDEVQGDPFFIWFAPLIPHTPFDAPQDLRDPYEALGLTTCADYDCFGHCNACANEVNYLANVTWLDSLVGELMSELEDRNLRDNTLIIYLTDNGWGLNYQFFTGTGKGKNTLYELGYRTPMIFSWPGTLPEGATYDDLVSSTDIAPTILDYVGIDTLPEQQGLSLRQRIEGGPSLGRTELIGLDEDTGHFLRTDTWRYLRFANDGHEELYQIDIDPFEDNDVAAANPALVAQFAAMVDAWEAEKRSPPDRIEIAGRVLDAKTGAALMGSRIRLENGLHPQVSIVGKDGWFRFGPVEPGSYVIVPDARSTSLDWLGSGNTVPADVPLAATGSWLNLTGTRIHSVPVPTGGTLIRGVLRDSTGNPIADAPISISGGIGCTVTGSQTITQPDGSYRLENLPFTTYTITATTPPGLEDVVVEDVVMDSVGTLTQDLVAYPE